MNLLPVPYARYPLWLGFAALAALASLVGAPAPVSAETLRGKVVGVTDGDTVRLLVDGRRQYKIRLGEIDAPEGGQPFGRTSRRMLSDLVFGRNVTARVTDIDRYGRSVAGHGLGWNAAQGPV